MSSNNEDVLDNNKTETIIGAEDKNNEPALDIPEPIVTDEYVDSTIERLRRRWRIREMSIYECRKNALSPEQEYAIIEIDKQQEELDRQDSKNGKLC